MSTQEEFLVAVFATSNAIILLITILLGGNLSKEKVQEGTESLYDIVNELRDAVENSEFTTPYVKNHVERLETLAKIIR